MNKQKHIKRTISEFDTTLNSLFDEYELDISLPIEKCISSVSIKDIIPTEEDTIFNQLDSVYHKRTKELFYTLKKIERLGAPKIYYYKDNTIKVTSTLIDNYRLDGHVDNLYNFKTTYLARLEKFLESLSSIKYIQYLVNIDGLILELGEPKLIIDGANIILRYPFDIDDIDNTVALIRNEFKKFKMEALSCVTVLKESGNDIYIPSKYEDYNFPKSFETALNDLEILSLFKSKTVEIVIDGKFENLYYFSAYEYMNNKTNRPYCYIYTKDNRLCDLEKSKLINKLLKLQDNLEVGI
ncbi:hypothetical protein [Intestinibacter sp.]